VRSLLFIFPRSVNHRLRWWRHVLLNIDMLTNWYSLRSLNALEVLIVGRAEESLRGRNYSINVSLQQKRKFNINGEFYFCKLITLCTILLCKIEMWPASTSMFFQHNQWHFTYLELWILHSWKVWIKHW